MAEICYKLWCCLLLIMMRLLYGIGMKSTSHFVKCSTYSYNSIFPSLLLRTVVLFRYLLPPNIVHQNPVNPTKDKSFNP
jgi:hypothetical protein